MEVLYRSACGMDVHKKTVTACVAVSGANGPARRETRTFSTMTGDLLAMSDWLSEQGVTHIAMESTGVYWKPIYQLLEGVFTVLLVNAMHVKRVPGRKTDVSDAEWLADLLRHGLLSASFIPPMEIRELREWTRLRKQLVRDRASAVNRVQKLLESMNIKLASVATDVFGVSGRAMLSALAQGERDAERLADLAVGRLVAKRAELIRALTGRVTPNGRRLLAVQMTHIEHLEASIDQCEQSIEALTRPFDEAVARLCTIPGVSTTTASEIVAAIGVDMSRFADAHHLASWAGMCPGSDESAGKRRSGKTRKGSPWLRAALTESAWAASHTKKTYLSAYYRRLATRRGSKRALVALGHTILVIAYHILRDGSVYRELGADFHDRLREPQIVKRLAKRIESLGYVVSVSPSAA